MGLLGGMARTAVVAGTATAVSNRVSRRQAERWAAQDAPPQQQYQEQPPQQAYYQAPPQPPAPAPAASGGGDSGSSDLIEQLQRLSQLHTDGALSDEEFAAAKAQLLG